MNKIIRLLLAAVILVANEAKGSGSTMPPTPICGSSVKPCRPPACFPAAPCIKKGTPR